MTDTIDTIPVGQACTRRHEALQSREFREGNSFDRMYKSYRIFCTKNKKQKQNCTKKEKKKQQKKQQKALSFKLCQLHQEVPRDSKQTKAVSVFRF